jgi:hypothetical protein
MKMEEVILAVPFIEPSTPRAYEFMVGWWDGGMGLFSLEVELLIRSSI